MNNEWITIKIVGQQRCGMSQMAINMSKYISDKMKQKQREDRGK